MNTRCFYRLKKRNRRGMTLIEVLLAASILGVMAIVVINALFYPRFLAVSSTFKQQAVHAGTDAMEKVFSQSYDSLANGMVSLGNLSDRYALTGRTVSGNRHVETLGGGGSPAYKRVTIMVSYPGGENPIVLETLRFNVP
jgi:prepilin-type N-terminal cleavage/methylation domain-containing protein